MLSRPLPTITERAARFLKEASYKQSRLGEKFNVNDTRILAATYSEDKNGVVFLMKMLHDQGLADYSSLGENFEITPQGYLHLDEMRSADVDSLQGFAAMWFDSSMDDTYSLYCCNFLLL